MATTHISAGGFQDKVPKENTSLIEILAVLIFGGIGMFSTLLGIYIDNLVLYTVGLVVVIASAWSAITKAGKSTIEFIHSILEFIDYLKDRFKKKDK